MGGRYSFSLAANQLLEMKLRVGYELNESELDHLKQISTEGKALERALTFVLIRPRSRQELDDYFRRKQWSASIQVQVMKYLEAHGHVDDVAFARAWIRSRQAGRGMSRRRLQLELRKKGVALDHIAAAFEAEPVDDQTSLQALIVRKRRQTRYQDTQRLMQYLARQGYSYDDITRALAEAEGGV